MELFVDPESKLNSHKVNDLGTSLPHKVTFQDFPTSSQGNDNEIFDQPLQTNETFSIYSQGTNHLQLTHQR